MKREADAVKLAEAMVKIGTMAGKKTAALVTDMSEPLGNMVGNSLEVIEAVEALKGNGPKDLMEDVYALGAKMLLFAECASNENEAYDKMRAVVADGSALEKFAQMVEAAGRRQKRGLRYQPASRGKAEASGSGKGNRICMRNGNLRDRNSLYDVGRRTGNEGERH